MNDYQCPHCPQTMPSHAWLVAHMDDAHGPAVAPRCHCGDRIEPVTDDGRRSWIHTPGSDTHCTTPQPRQGGSDARFIQARHELRDLAEQTDTLIRRFDELGRLHERPSEVRHRTLAEVADVLIEARQYQALGLVMTMIRETPS